MVNGKLLQMNKNYKDLKNRQKDKIAGWMYEAYKKQAVGEESKMNVISVDEYKESGIYTKEQAVKQTVPIYEKVTLTIREAAEYSNIGINKLESLLRSPRCPFVLYVGKKKLVKRKEFEKFIMDNIEI